MEKKEYKQPSTQVYLIHPTHLLADSGGTGASGGDVPWGVRRRNSRYDNSNDEDVFDY